METTKDKKPSAATAQLRRLAEDRLAEKKKELHHPRSENDAQRLVHELEVHQIELEMQNADLCQARDELEAVLQKYTDLYDFAPVGYITLAANGNILAANLACTGLLGLERSRLINRCFRSFVAPNDIPPFNTFLDLIFVNQKKTTCEVMLLHEKGHTFFAQIEAISFGVGVEQECLMALIDISERKRAQQELALKIIQLESAMAKVRQLEGIIPICSYCKKIRDDKQSWQQLERYITEHSEAWFSHSICPECAERLKD